MSEWLYNRYRVRYIAVVMLMTRLIGSIGGSLAIYYVLITTRLEQEFVREFVVGCVVAVALAVAGTMPLAMWNTRTLRRVLHRLHEGLPVDGEEGRKAAREAVCFPSRQNSGEAVIVPLLSILPMCTYMWWRFDPRPQLYVQLTIAGGLAIAAVLLITFIASERWMQVVVLDLIKRGVRIDFEALPQSRLRRRMVVCFGLISMLTSTMIGALANQRALDIIQYPVRQTEAVESLRWHTLYITLVSLVVGFVYSRLLADSVASRANRLVKSMQRVQAGDFTQRARPTGTDEIDALARQFNCMVENLEQHDRTVRDLNANLERKVQSRTEELAQSKRSLQVSLEKLRESDRHKTEFFSNVSHELRTPLMMILSPLEQIAARESAGLSSKTKSLIDVASVNAHRLLKLINQLLDFAKFEAGHAQLHVARLNPNELVASLVAAAQPLAEQRGLSLSTHLDASLCSIEADAEKLDAVITNLVSNALKFTPRGGQVRVSTSRMPDTGLDGLGPRMRIAVEDTGIGIAPENFSRLFQRFSQIDGSTSRAFAGTGIGLALAKEIVELHGGDIHVESSPGQGSCFWFTLPARAVPDAHVDDVPAPAPIVRAERFADLQQCDVGPHAEASGELPADAPTVLVVDDTPEVRRLVGEILGSHYHVRYAEDGERGWESVLVEKPDLIISDVMMPKVDGYELCRRVKSRRDTEAIPFVLLTARAQTSLKIEGLNCGADDYLVKPFNAEELLARVRALLRLHELHTDLEENNSRLEATLAELQETQCQLVQSEKMNSLGQLVAGVAHEINNAINAVCNGIPAINERLDRLQRLTDSLLRAPPEDPAAARRELDQAFRMLHRLASVVEEGAGRTARIVGDMKTFSHPGSETFEPFDLNAALDLCVSLLDKQYRERIRVNRDYQVDHWIRGPYGRLNQVFINLLTNAAEAMANGGEIDIATRIEGACAVVSIRDTGTGIPEAIRSRIFDPFFTTKGPGKGTGLGLSTSYGIITRLGGRIECHSLEGIGTEFILHIPVNPANVEASNGSPKPEEQPQLSLAVRG
jgi:signal transduction histidine kinase